MRQQRRTLSPQERKWRAAAVCRYIQTSRSFRKARSIAFYLPNDGEIDLRPLIDVALKQGKRCLLPVLDKLIERRLFFAPYDPDTPLALNRYGIPEPDTHPKSLVRPRAIDLILMPLVAFDNQGNRIGMGGGYYDRTLSFLRHRQRWYRPKLVGVAFAFQQVDSITARSWDIPLHLIATDTGIIAPCKQRG